jgi:16S rRNA (uracil1498-N3)-methyltransferase
MAWVIQKATELGVTTIVPLVTRRGVVQPKPERVEAQTARWQRIALEAAQQSEQWSIPVVTPPEHLTSFLAAARGSRSLILTERQQSGVALRNVELPTAPSENITLAVGPEGGWAGEETAQAEQSGFLPVTLGEPILRAETAALVAVALVQFRIGLLG